jgi:serine-type D-Ala-D-Ala carboxypeptidase (penicillin-binding protein 5/6)
VTPQSPLLPPSRRRRPPRRRRSPFRALAGGTALLTVVLVAFAAFHTGHGVSGRPETKGTAPSSSRGGHTPGRPIQPAGTDDAALLSFHHPPRAGLLFDLDTGRVFWSINATQVLPIASLVKMMTALLVVRGASADAAVLVTRNAVNAAGSKVGVLPKGKRVRLETLLYGLLLPSGNDAAVALAEHVAGSVPAFVRRMNEQAAHMGLRCTHYVSPDGLEDANRSCAMDLATLARADLDEPLIARVAGSANAVQPLPIKGGKVWLYNNNPLLRYGYPGADGLKTGETEAAGLCLVGTAERDGVRLGVVLLHSPELGRQAAALLDRGFQDVYHQAPIPAPPIPKGR